MAVSAGAGCLGRALTMRAYSLQRFPFFPLPTPVSPLPLCKIPLSLFLSPGSGAWSFIAIWRLWIPPDLPTDQSLSYTLICHLKACLETPALFHSSPLFSLALFSFRAAPVFYPLGICFRGSSRPSRADVKATVCHLPQSPTSGQNLRH